MHKPWYLLAVTTLLLSLTGCGGAQPNTVEAPADVLVSAAASMTDALTEAKAAFEREHSDIQVTFTFGSSGALAQQIEQGAPVDLFIAAGPDPMDRLVKKGLVESSAVKTVAVNTVVLIRSQSATAVVKGWHDLTLPAVKRIAIGSSEHVPAGQYARAALEHLGIWEAVVPRLVMGEDARQVLNHVESGEVEAGIVYATDAATSDTIIIIAEAPEGSHPPVTYPIAPIKASAHTAEADAFAQFLLTGPGRDILQNHGFGAGE